MNWNCRPLDFCPCLFGCLFFFFLLFSFLGKGWVSSQRLFRMTMTRHRRGPGVLRILFVSCLFRHFSGSGQKEIPAVPGGRGIFFAVVTA